MGTPATSKRTGTMATESMPGDASERRLRRPAPCTAPHPMKTRRYVLYGSAAVVVLIVALALTFGRRDGSELAASPSPAAPSPSSKSLGSAGPPAARKGLPRPPPPKSSVATGARRYTVGPNTPPRGAPPGGALPGGGRLRTVLAMIDGFGFRAAAERAGV